MDTDHWEIIGKYCREHMGDHYNSLLVQCFTHFGTEYSDDEITEVVMYEWLYHQTDKLKEQ
jgi:hypothetical protein